MLASASPFKQLSPPFKRFSSWICAIFDPSAGPRAPRHQSDVSARLHTATNSPLGVDSPKGPRRESCLSRSFFGSASKDPRTLQGVEDRYDGVLIDSKSLPGDRDEFAQRLDFSLQEWARKRKRGIWLRLSPSQVGLAELAVSAGFNFHHAERSALVLTKWLSLEMPNMLPEGATHQVGVGAFVLNQHREVLLVQEGLGILRDQGLWKLPTGLTNLGEDIPQAVEREVREETGIKTRFDRVLAIRQSHGHNLGRSDLFFVCGMKLLEGPQEIALQKDELAAAAWHSLDDAEQLPLFRTGPIFRAIFERCKAYADGHYEGWNAEKIENGFTPEDDLLFTEQR